MRVHDLRRGETVASCGLVGRFAGDGRPDAPARALSVIDQPTFGVVAGTGAPSSIGRSPNWRVSRGFDPMPDSVERRWHDRIPMGRYQQPERIARTILFPASGDASEATGECINVSGGAVME